MLQLTFLKVHEAARQLRAGANPIPWIYTIAHRTSLDEIRKRKRSRVRLSNDGELAAEPAAHITGVAADANADPADRPDPSVAAGALAALAKLPENQRQALILTKVHGRSIADAAMITGSTPGAIKQRAHRAYVTLRQLLGAQGDRHEQRRQGLRRTPARRGDRRRRAGARAVARAAARGRGHETGAHAYAVRARRRWSRWSGSSVRRSRSRAGRCAGIWPRCRSRG